MYRMRPDFRILAVALAGLSVVSAPAATPGPAATKPVPPALSPGPVPGAGTATAPDSVNPVEYKSLEGRFQAVYPSGCARLQTKTSFRPGAQEEVTSGLVVVSCDRAGARNEGCAVAAKLGAAAGVKGKAAVDLVLKAVNAQLTNYGVQAFRQTPLHRDFGKRGAIEGIEILAQRPDGVGDVWIRGLLFGDDIYTMTAWKSAGGLWNDPAYARFFDSFRPWAE